MKSKVLGIAALTVAVLSANLFQTEVRAAPTEVRLDRAQKEKLDTFFSNFSEAGVQPFDSGKVSNKQLIDFGIKHNQINKAGRVTTVGAKGRLAAKHVVASVDWYFGKKITRHESTGFATYKNGYYYFPLAEGEGPTFSQITRLVDAGKGYYTASVGIYSAANGWEWNPHGTTSEWKRADDGSGIPELKGRLSASIKKVGTGATQHYILVEYLKVK